MSFLRRLFARVQESDQDRLADEIREWAADVPDTQRIGDAPARTQVKLAGVVKRIRVNPVEGNEAIEAVLTDGTGEMQVVWMGRRTIRGLTLGTSEVVEGVVGERRAGRKMVNPKFEFRG